MAELTTQELIKKLIWHDLPRQLKRIFSNIPQEAPDDENSYIRKGKEWVVLPTSESNILSDFGNDEVNPSLGTFTIQHNIGKLPDYVGVHFSSYGSIELREYLTEVTEEDITITFQNAPSDTELIVWWEVKANP